MSTLVFVLFVVFFLSLFSNRLFHHSTYNTLSRLLLTMSEVTVFLPQGGRSQ